MDDKADRLRRHAQHCRQMAGTWVDSRTRIILLTMATEFDGQASDIDGAKPIVPEA